MKISSIEARTCFLFELKMRSKLPFNVTMSKGSITLAAVFVSSRNRALRNETKRAVGRLSFSWMLGETKRQNSFRVQSLRIPIGVLKLYHPD